MKNTFKSYVKNFQDFEVKVRPSLNGRHFYMSVDTAHAPYFFESSTIYYPNFIERWFGVTAESKLARYEKKLFGALLRKMKTADPRVTLAIHNFLEE